MSTSRESSCHPRRQIANVALLLVVLAAPGCVTIQRSPTLETSDCQWQDHRIPSQESCPLYDRGEVAKQWAKRLNPTRLVPQRTKDWAALQKARCFECKCCIEQWAHRKKEEANAPPWPRFHPVPTKPVFEPEADNGTVVPEIYGRFGGD